MPRDLVELARIAGVAISDQRETFGILGEGLDSFDSSGY